jgi:probable F420-dependent oxidoreductase
MRFPIWNTSGDPQDFFAVAGAAQEAGWSSLCLNEGTFQPVVQEQEIYPFTADGKRAWSMDTPFLEPMTLLPALATHYQELRFLTWVLKLPLREPLTFAKQIATAAIMMNNRLDLGVGMSWMPQEYTYTGLDWDTRRQRFIETIEVLRLVLSGEVVEYHGEVLDFGPLMERPVPSKPVPIMIGGHKPASLRMAAKLADGWCGVVAPEVEIFGIIERLHELVEAEGRDPASFTVHAGTLEAATVEDFARLEKAGIIDCVVMPWMKQLSEGNSAAMGVPLNQRIDLIHEFAERVIKPLNGQ